MWQEGVSLKNCDIGYDIGCDITVFPVISQFFSVISQVIFWFSISGFSAVISSTDVLLLIIQVLSQDGKTIVLMRTMMAAIQKWILMICAILKTKILTFHQVQLPISDHTHDFSQTCPAGLICLKTLSTRHFQHFHFHFHWKDLHLECTTRLINL